MMATQVTNIYKPKQQLLRSSYSLQEPDELAVAHFITRKRIFVYTMEANCLDSTAVFTCDRESSSTQVQLELEKDMGKLTCCDDPMLNQVASMPYRHCRVSIFKKADRFFYEPIVLLEEVNRLTKQECRDGQVEATLKIKLWDHDLEHRVVNYLRSEVGDVGLKAHQVQVMPYEEVRLVAKNTSSIRVLTGVVCLLQLPVEVTFNLLFSSDEKANFLTEFLVDHLELHFTSSSPQILQGTAEKYGEDVATLHRDSAFRVHHNSVFGINIVSQSIRSREDEEAIAINFWLYGILCKIRNLEISVDGLPERFKDGVCVPVFGVSTHPTKSKAKYVTYTEFAYLPLETQGVFDMTTGVFTAKSAGVYLFQFEGVSCNNESIQLHLKVNGITKAKSQPSGITNQQHSGKVREKGGVAMDCLSHIKSGDQVGIFLESGALSTNSPETTHFWCIFLAGDNRD